MEVFETYTACTLKGKRHLFDEAWDIVMTVMRSAPDVLLTTVTRKHGWLNFKWDFDLEGGSMQVEMVRNEINRRIRSFNAEHLL